MKGEGLGLEGQRTGQLSEEMSLSQRTQRSVEQPGVTAPVGLPAPYRAMGTGSLSCSACLGWGKSCALRRHRTQSPAAPGSRGTELGDTDTH